MARILRIGHDAATNYHFDATSAYDATNPAATTSAWSDADAMDQKFTQPGPREVTAQGALVTFDRFPDTFTGAQVKIVPTYNASGGDVPALELWTHDSSDHTWTKRRRLELTNVFVGVPSGEHRILDFTFFPYARHVDKVWITLDPGAVGTPTLAFDAIALYGLCDGMLRTPNPNGPPVDPDPCLQNPFTPDCMTGATDCSKFPSLCDVPVIPDLDVCNPVSIALYEEAISAIPGALEQFEAWLAENEVVLTAACAGNGPFPDVPVPPGPTLPPLDLCDPTSIDAFRAAIAGNATQLAEFEAFLTAIDAQGFLSSCAPLDPQPVPIDPSTGQPTTDQPVPRPGGAGPGGVPDGSGSGTGPDSPGVPADGDPTKPPGKRRSPSGSDSAILERTQRTVWTWSGSDTAAANTLAAGLITALPASTITQQRETRSDHWGPATSPSTATMVTPAAYGFRIWLTGLPFECLVGLRMQVFRLTGTADLGYSISDAGINTVAPFGFCPSSPDWIITPAPSGSFGALNARSIGDNYGTYLFTGTGLKNDAYLDVLLPREDPTQNDGATCSAGFKPRNVHSLVLSDASMAFQRGGCISGPTTKLRARWLRDVSLLDYANTIVTDYLHVRPYAFVFDVTIRASLVGSGFDLGSDSAIAVRAISDAQPVETCP